MDYTKLGSSDLNISKCCLGTMTWGNRNTQEEGHAQIDYAINQGINFLDTAEMYAVPPSAKTYGTTETVIGNWIAKNPTKRKDLVIMTKIAGSGLSYIRNSEPILAKYIMPAIDDSLKRLQTDYIDVYQLHWPNRANPAFGRHWPGSIDHSTVNTQQQEDEIHEVLQELEKAVKAGKIRYPGLSNESPWGMDLYMRLAKDHNLPTMVSMQNEFSLLHSIDWPYVIEAAVHHDIAYLPWSALGGGVLSGKYVDGKIPPNSRWSVADRHRNFRNKPNVHAAVGKYVDIAKKNNITPAQLSYAWCNQFKWITATIIGATSMEQLKENIEAFDLTLSAEIMTEITEVHKNYPVAF